MTRNFKSLHFCSMLAGDAALVLAAYSLAYLLRFDGHIPPENMASFKYSILFVVPIKIACFMAFGLHRVMLKHTGLLDLINVLKACLVSSICLFFIVVFFAHFSDTPRSIFFIDFFLTFLAIGGIRVVLRLFLSNNPFSFLGFRRPDPSAKKLIIIGAGAAGAIMYREIIENPRLKQEPVGFLDDDQSKQGKSIYGVPILGSVENIRHISLDYDEILIAIPSAKSDQMRIIVTACERTGKKFLTMPSIGELIDGKVSVKLIREVRIEDLIGRKEVRLERDLLHKSYESKRILITGAGGSIGSELVKQICRYAPQELALLDISEFNLFQVEALCKADFSYVPVKTYLRDIRDKGAVARTFREFKPTVVFHAAAYKHVPLQEAHPRETIYNNVLGTKNLAEAARDEGVVRFVLVSTDKAVRPTNVMGATKRVAEISLQCMNGTSPTRFMAVRFGNVIGSSGSVIPIFQQQIAQRQPLTVTHPDVTRYFMSIPEAAQLILQAGAMGQGGEIFILDMGKPVRIADMARDLIRIHGLEPETDIPIHYVGLRPGEKLFEELITEGEGIEDTTHEKIKVIHQKKDNNLQIESIIDELIATADSYDDYAIKQKLTQIVPEYTPQQSMNNMSRS